MATLPRYETMGVQYADLPRLSTAPQQAAAEGFSRMSQSLDRMVNFIQGELETKAQREAKKYAVENPLTEETIRAAMRGEPVPKIEGAGEIFQQTYEAVQGTLLASQLQAEGNREISVRLSRIKEGGEVNLEETRTYLKDMIDGYATAVAAFSPEQSIKLRAALTMSGNSLFETVAQVSQQRQRDALVADWQAMADNSAPLIEAVFATKAGKIDPTTGQPYNVQKILEGMSEDFRRFAMTPGGSVKPLETFNKLVSEARVNAVVAAVTDPAFAASNAEAIRKLRAKNVGDLSGVYKGLSQDQQEAVIKRAVNVFNEQTSVENAQRAEEDRKKKEATNALQLELLGKPTATRKRQIVSDLVASGAWSVQTAESYLSPAAASAKANPVELLAVKDLIQRGAITSIPQLVAGWRSKLSDDQIKEAGNYLLNESSRSADRAMDQAAGLVGFSINPSEDKIRKRAALQQNYNSALAKGLSFADAAAEAIKQYDGDKTNQQRLAKREAARQTLEKAILAAGAAVPNVPTEQIDIGALKRANGKSIDDANRKAIQSALEAYRSIQ